jgi:hypothetical protein
MTGPETAQLILSAAWQMLLLLVLVWGMVLAHRLLRASQQPAPVPAALPGAVVSRLRHRLVVTLKSGDSFDGLLVEADERVWVLRSASAVGEGDNRTDLPIDGEIILMTADIAYAQKP